MADISRFDTSELDKYSASLFNLAKEKMPKEIDRFLKSEANKGKRLALKIAESSVKQKTGNYFKGFKTSKVFNFDFGESRAIKTLIGAPAYHRNLLEYGHRIVRKDKTDTGKMSTAYKVFERAKSQSDTVFYNDCKKLVDRLLEKGL